MSKPTAITISDEFQRDLFALKLIAGG